VYAACERGVPKKEKETGDITDVTHFIESLCKGRTF